MTEIIIKSGKDKNHEGSKMYEVIMRILMSSGVPPDQIDDCLNWAFGPGCLYVPIYPDWIDRWNKLHPNAFRAARKDKFVEFVYVIGFSFCVAVKKAAFGKKQSVGDLTERN